MSNYTLFLFYRWDTRPERPSNLPIATQRESGWARTGTHDFPPNTCVLTHHGRLTVSSAETERLGGPLLSISLVLTHSLSYLSSPDLDYGFCSKDYRVLPLRLSLHFEASAFQIMIRKDLWFIKRWKLAVSVKILVCSGIAYFSEKCTCSFSGWWILGVRRGCWLGS